MSLNMMKEESHKNGVDFSEQVILHYYYPCQ